MVLPSRNHAVVLVSKLHMPTLRALAYARATRPDVLEAITVSVDDAETRELVHKWQDSDITVPLKVVASPYREITRPVLDYVKRITKDSPRTVVTVFIPEYVVGHWWEQTAAQPECAAAQGQAAVRTQCDGDFGSVATEFVGAAQDAGTAVGARRRPAGHSWIEPADAGGAARPPTAAAASRATTAGWCSCATRCPVRRCVRGSPGERGSYWHAEAVEVLEPSPDRIDPICPIAGADGAGCCDLAFVDSGRAAGAQGTGGGQPAAAAGRLSAESGDAPAGGLRRADGLAHPGAAGGRSRRPAGFSPLPQRRVGHRSELRPDRRRHARRPGGEPVVAGGEVHVVRDDDETRHVVCTGRDRRTRVVEGGYEGVHRVGDRRLAAAGHGVLAGAPRRRGRLQRAGGRVVAAGAGDDAPGTSTAARGCSRLRWRRRVGDAGHVLSVDTSRAAARAGRAALADFPQVRFVTDSVQRALAAQPGVADVAVLDPPRAAPAAGSSS